MKIVDFKSALLVLLLVFAGCQRSVDPGFIVTKVRSAAKLATTEVIVNKVVWSEIEEKKLLGFIKEDNTLLFDTEATIKLGIDLNKVGESDIKMQGDTLIVHLPDVEIINFSYPHEKFYQIYPISDFDEINSQDKIEKLDKNFRLAETDIRNKIELLNLKDPARRRTIKFMQSFLHKLGYANVQIKIKQQQNQQL